MKNDNNIKDRNDRNNSRNKVKFIIAWYHNERTKLKDNQKITLLNRWITSCTVFEEYEMSNALLNEKRILVRQMRLKKVGKKPLWKVIILHLKAAKRNFNFDLKKLYNGIRSTIQRKIS